MRRRRIQMRMKILNVLDVERKAAYDLGVKIVKKNKKII